MSVSDWSTLAVAVLTARKRGDAGGVFESVRFRSDY